LKGRFDIFSQTLGWLAGGADWLRGGGVWGRFLLGLAARREVWSRLRREGRRAGRGRTLVRILERLQSATGLRAANHGAVPRPPPLTFGQKSSVPGRNVVGVGGCRRRRGQGQRWAAGLSGRTGLQSHPASCA
jgi:hypothetical protein